MIDGMLPLKTHPAAGTKRRMRVEFAVKDLPQSGRALIDVDAGKFDRDKYMVRDLCTFKGTPEAWADTALVDQYVVYVFTQLVAR